MRIAKIMLLLVAVLALATCGNVKGNQPDVDAPGADDAPEGDDAPLGDAAPGGCTWDQSNWDGCDWG